MSSFARSGADDRSARRRSVSGSSCCETRLSDDPGNPRYVEGVRGQGYRLLPRVEVLPDESPARHRRRWVVPMGAAISLAAAAAIVFWIMTAQTDAVRESTSVAVLPFTDLSPGRDQQYLADGLAEEIINLLSKATTLRVIARTSSFSFRGKDADVARISKALGVTHVLEGSVRKEGDRIRVTVRLVDASNGSRLWSESYDQQVGDVLAVETNVARSVAAELRANLQNLADVPAKGVNAEAYDLYLRGQHELRMREFGASRALPRTGDRDRRRVHPGVSQPRWRVCRGGCRRAGSHGREPSQAARDGRSWPASGAGRSGPARAQCATGTVGRRYQARGAAIRDRSAEGSLEQDRSTCVREIQARSGLPGRSARADSSHPRDRPVEFKHLRRHLV